MPENLTRENVASQMGIAAATATAQLTGQGLGIQNIRRGVLWVTSTATANMTVANATVGWAALSTPIRGDIVLSGRPLLIMVAGIVAAGASGGVFLSATLRGVEVTGKAFGIPGTSHGATTIVGVSGWWVVPAPTAGRATIELVADATTADATVYTDAANNAASLLAVEL